MKKTNSGKVSIRDVAREVGVSITTVSRALNGYSDVSEKTKKKDIGSGAADGLCTRRKRAFDGRETGADDRPFDLGVKRTG